MKNKDLKTKLIALANAAVIVLVMYIFRLPCPYKAILTIPCMGCGMTRAYLSLLSLNFEKAFQYHPMFWSVPILIVFFFFDGKVFKRKWVNVLILTVIFSGFFVSWVIKLVLMFLG